MNTTEYMEYYRYVKLNDRRKAEMVERCGGLKTVLDGLKERQESIDEAVDRIKAQIQAKPTPETEKISQVVEAVLVKKGVISASKH